MAATLAIRQQFKRLSIENNEVRWCIAERGSIDPKIYVKTAQDFSDVGNSLLQNNSSNGRLQHQ